MGHLYSTHFVWWPHDMNCELYLKDPSSLCHTRYHAGPGTFLCASPSSPHSWLLLPDVSALHCRSLALSQLALSLSKLPLSTPLPQFALTIIAYPFILVCLLCEWLAFDRVMRSAARLIGQIPKFSHVTSCTCWRFCAGSPSDSV